jgi:chorismate mutase
MRLIKTKRNFRKEFKRQLRYAIAAAVGFVIIYAWKESILDMTNNLVEKIQETTAIASSDIASALIISIAGVLIIIISSKLLKD